VGLERSPLSLVSTTEELLERKCNGSRLEILEYGRRGPLPVIERHVVLELICILQLFTISL
jgi:hypothetical protein